MTTEKEVFTSDDLRVLKFAAKSYIEKLKGEHWMVMPYLPAGAVKGYTENSLKIEERVNNLIRKMEGLFTSQFDESCQKPVIDNEDFSLMAMIVSLENSKIGNIRSQALMSLSSVNVEDKYLEEVIGNIDKDLRELTEAFARYNNTIHAH